MNNLVSVIVPVYNVELYIKRCLDSISGQTYHNLEIIVVDDGSKDKSATICKECADADSRIRLIEKENEGAGYARNTGLDVANGDYIFFVDSDDYIMPNCIERLLSIALAEKADIVKCSYIEGCEKNYNIIPEKKPYKTYTNVSAFRTRNMNIAVHGKLYKKSVIGNVRYPKESTFDDEFFTYKLIFNAPKVIILDEPYYYYYVNPNSIMRSKKKKMPLQYIKAYEERMAFFSDKAEFELVGISHKELAIRLMLSYMNRYRYEKCDMNAKEMLSLFRKEYKQGCSFAVGIKEKISLQLFNLFPNCFTKVMHLVGLR